MTRSTEKLIHAALRDGCREHCDALIDELRRLHAENFALAAGQCMNVVGDEGGSPICAKAQQLQAARERDNVSFKQLLAQRDALLEALKLARSIIGHPDDAHTQMIEAAIKAVEGEGA